MLEAQKIAHSSSGKSVSQIKFDKQRVDILDKHIDALVYELYGLTDDEIKIVVVSWFVFEGMWDFIK